MTATNNHDHNDAPPKGAFKPIPHPLEGSPANVHRIQIEGRGYEVQIDSRAFQPERPLPNNAGQRMRNAFGAGCFIHEGQGRHFPFTRTHWLIAFETYLAQRWYDSNHPFPVLFQGPNAKEPALAPLVEIVRARGVFDLHDPLMATVWEDYLSEHPIRRQLWERYEREHGAQRALYWRNAQGEAWEAAQGQEGTHKGDA